MATIKEAIDRLLKMDSAEIDEFVSGKATVKKATKAAETTADAPTSYNGESNIMKLKKMAREAGMEVTNATKKAEVIAYLEDNGGKKVSTKNTSKEDTTAEDLTPDNFDVTKRYTREELEAVPARTLYNIARKVFNIPNNKLKAKPDSVEEILKIQDGDGEEVPDYTNMKATELWKLLKERGIKAPVKKKEKFYIDMLVKDDEEQVHAAEEANAEEAESEIDLESMSAIDLYKLCKSRGIKAKTKQEKDYYIDLLSPKDEEEDEWGEDEEEDEEDKWNL